MDNAIINVNGDALQALDVSLLLVAITLLPTLGVKEVIITTSEIGRAHV